MYGVIIVLCIGIVTSIVMLVSRPEQPIYVEDEDYVEDEEIVMVDSDPEPEETVSIEPVERLMIIGDNVNVRSIPSTDGSRLGSAYRGYDFEYLGMDDSGEWFKITYDGSTGYIFKDFGEIKTMYMSEDGSYLEY